jgi:hypothetical protein
MAFIATAGFSFNDYATECMTMLNTKILLMSTMSPAAAWAASVNMGPSLLIIQVVCGVAVSFALFMAILRMTESRNIRGSQRAPARSRLGFASHVKRLPTM